MEDYELEVEGSPNSSYMALLFGVRFTVKRYGMKKYPFLFVSNIATTENNTSFRQNPMKATMKLVGSPLMVT